MRQYFGTQFQWDLGSGTGAAGVSAGLRDVIVCILIVLCVSLPFFLGGAHPLGILWLHSLCGCVCVLWVGALLLERRLPRMPAVLGICICLGLAQGWTAVWNHSFDYLGAHQGFEARSFTEWLPGAVDGALSAAALRHGSLLCVMLGVVLDLSSQSQHRRRLLLGLFFAGSLQLLVGLVQKLSNSPSVLGLDVGGGLPFFAAFLYSGSAGAFINATLPAFFLPSREQRFLRIRGALAQGAGMLAVLWNTSRISAAVALGMALCAGAYAFLGGPGGRFGEPGRRQGSEAGLQWWRRWSGVLATLFLGGLALAVFPTLPLVEKWQRYSGQLHAVNPRVEAFGIAMEMLRDAGAWGMGAGTFGAAFPHYAHSLSEAGRGVWRHAHCDYLEWLVEWGWVGALVWGVLPLGAIWGVVQKVRFSPNWADRREALCVGFALGALALHALADFPLHNPGIQLVGVVWLGLAWSYIPASGEEAAICERSGAPAGRMHPVGGSHAARPGQDVRIRAGAISTRFERAGATRNVLHSRRAVNLRDERGDDVCT